MRTIGTSPSENSAKRRDRAAIGYGTVGGGPFDEASNYNAIATQPSVLY